MVQPFIPNSADAAITEQAEPDSEDFEYLAAATALTGVVSGCVLSGGVSDRTFDVASGKVRINGRPVAVSAQAGNALTANATGNLRIDLVSINLSGTVVVTDGTAAAEPVAPALPADQVQIGWVYMPSGDDLTDHVQIVAKRTLVPDNDGLYNVKWYGALGDGSTDDTTEIQAAIDAANTAGGGTVYFPNGSYLVTATLNYYTDITFLGQTMGSVEIKTQHSSTVFSPNSVVSRLYYVWFKNLNFWSSSGTNDIVIDFDRITYGGMEHVVIANFDTATTAGIRLRSSTSDGECIWNNFFDVQVTSMNVTALLMDSTYANNNRFFGCSFRGNATSGSVGILMNAGSSNHFDNCSTELSETGIKIDTSVSTEIAEGNTFYNHRFETNTNGVVLAGAWTKGNTIDKPHIASNVTTPWSDTTNQANSMIFTLQAGTPVEFAQQYNDGPVLYIGTGVPAFSADETSLFLRTDGTGNIYVNTDGGTTWSELVRADGTIAVTSIGASVTTERVAFGTGDVTIYDGVAKRIEVLDGGDINLYDEDGTTARLTWDETAGVWIVGSDIQFDSAGGTSDYLYMLQGLDYFAFRMVDQSGTPAQSTILLFGPNHSTQAGDIEIRSPSDGATVLLWDESDDRLELSKTIDMQGNTIRDVNRAVEYASSPTLDWDDHIVSINSSAATRAVTLPSCATYNGHAFFIQRDGTNSVTIDPGTDTFSDTGTSTDKTLGSDGASIGLYSIGGTEWKVAGTSGTVT